ncbi:MAG: hypothetical protein AAGA12_09285 [Pseudomonadota bacterium]
MSDLENRLLAAHARHDKPELAKLYQEAAANTDDIGSQGFFLTQAYIFALDCGAPEASQLREKLSRMGRI